MGVALCVLPVLTGLSAPPTRDLLDEVKAFRARGGPALGVWREEGASQPLSFSVVADEGGPRLETDDAWLRSRDDGPGPADLVACWLACTDVGRELPTRLGASLDLATVGLEYDADGVLTYVIGGRPESQSVADGAQLTLVVNRDDYRPRSVSWLAASGERIQAVVTAYGAQGWVPAKLLLRRGSTSREFARVAD